MFSCPQQGPLGKLGSVLPVLGTAAGQGWEWGGGGARGTTLSAVPPLHLITGGRAGHPRGGTQCYPQSVLLDVLGAGRQQPCGLQPGALASALDGVSAAAA